MAFNTIAVAVIGATWEKQSLIWCLLAIDNEADRRPRADENQRASVVGPAADGVLPSNGIRQTAGRNRSGLILTLILCDGLLRGVESFAEGASPESAIQRLFVAPNILQVYFPPVRVDWTRKQ